MGSQILISRCYIDKANGIVWIDVKHGASETTAYNLKFKTLNFGVKNPASVSSLDSNSVSIRFFAHFSDSDTLSMSSANFVIMMASWGSNPTFLNFLDTHTPALATPSTKFSYPYERYVNEFTYYNTNHYAPVEFDLLLPTAFLT